MDNTRVFGMVYGPAPGIGTGIKTAPVWYVLEVILAFYQLYTSPIPVIYLLYASQKTLYQDQTGMKVF
jgi:hypothetical protein